MKVIEMKSILKTEKFDNYNCNFKITKGGRRTTLDDVLIEMREGFKQVNARIDQVEANLTARIDNLVAKNNLKE